MGGLASHVAVAVVQGDCQRGYGLLGAGPDAGQRQGSVAAHLRVLVPECPRQRSHAGRAVLACGSQRVGGVHPYFGRLVYQGVDQARNGVTGCWADVGQSLHGGRAHFGVRVSRQLGQGGRRRAANGAQGVACVQADGVELVPQDIDERGNGGLAGGCQCVGRLEARGLVVQSQSLRQAGDGVTACRAAVGVRCASVPAPHRLPGARERRPALVPAVRVCVGPARRSGLLDAGEHDLDHVALLVAFVGHAPVPYVVVDEDDSPGVHLQRDLAVQPVDLPAHPYGPPEPVVVVGAG